jgi:putative ABC transport system permease protein
MLGTAYGPDVKDNFPEVKEFVRFNLRNYANPIVSLDEGEKEQRIENFSFADKSVFEVFSFEFILGDKETALSDPQNVVLTESVAQKLFGDSNPIGEQIILEKEHPLVVSGVIEDVSKFHMDINAIGEFSHLAEMRNQEGFLHKYGGWNYPTYLLLEDGVNIDELNEKISNFFEGVYKKKFNSEGELNFHLTSLHDIYFDKDTKYETGVKHGNMRFIYIFIAIAVFILAIAAINFINLTTAKAVNRSKEVGLRKVVGGIRKQLLSQFLSESVLISLIAFLFALGLVEILLPKFNTLLQAEISNHYYAEPFFWIIFVSGILVVGILSGLYPAFYLTSFSPVSVMKSEQTKGKKGAGFRKALTIFQFFISIVLIIGTVTIYRQIHYMKNKDMGFDKEHQIYFSTRGYIPEQREAFKQELLKNNNIKYVSFTSKPAGRITRQESWIVNGEKKQFTYQPADPDYVKLMDLEIIQGENFSWDKPSYKGRKGVLLNETAVKYFGLENPVGKKINLESQYWDDVIILGVMKDFHYNSLHQQISPLVVGWHDRSWTVNLKVSGNDMASTIEHMQNTWNKFVSDYPLEYHFLDQSLDRQYRSDERFGSLFTYFAFFAILIACLGLYGLSLFSTQQRRKEIGVRKANGASVENIVQLFLKEFSMNVLIANLIAWPAAYFFMDKWLNNFPYRINTEFWIFGLALVISLLIATLTVSYNTIKAANTNPARILRYE